MLGCEWFGGPEGSWNDSAWSSGLGLLTRLSALRWAARVLGEALLGVWASHQGCTVVHDKHKLEGYLVFPHMLPKAA